MTERFDPDIKQRARELRDALLAEVEDKTDPRYIALTSVIESDKVEPCSDSNS